jgi:DnaJ-domain-containing protein 1
MKTTMSPPLKIRHEARRSRNFQDHKKGISIVYAHVQTSKGSDQWKKNSNTSSSLYHVLGLSFGATREEIKASYRRLARLHHPDAAPPDGKDKSAQDFMEINTAYTTLSNPHSRADYDRLLITSMKVRNGGIYGGKLRGQCWETDQCL